MAVQRTKPNKGYYTPSKAEIRAKFTELGASKNLAYPPSLVKDICNVLSYKMQDEDIEGAFVSPEEWDWDKVPFVKSSKEDKKERAEENSKRHQKAVAREHKIQDFLREMDYDKVAGDSPLDKAANLVALLAAKSGASMSKAKADKEAADKSGTSEEESGDDAEGNTLDRMFQQGDESSQDVSDMLAEQLELMDKVPIGSFTAKALGMDKGLLAGVEASHLNKFQLEVLRKLAIFQKKSRISASTRRSTEEDPNSKKKQVLAIKEYTEVSKVPSSAMMLPTFDYKLATKQLSRAKGIKTTNHKQLLCLLIDDSSSMKSYGKLSWVKALMINRLQQVIEGKAELYICTFEGELDSSEWIACQTPAQAEAILAKYDTYFKFQRGGTDMQVALDEAIKTLKEGSMMTKNAGLVKLEGERPQICLINDGQDTLDESFVPSMVTHGFILDGKHTGMKSMCNRSGGLYEEFHSEGSDRE